MRWEPGPKADFETSVHKLYNTNYDQGLTVLEKNWGEWDGLILILKRELWVEIEF